MHFLHRRQPSLFQAPFTQGMRGGVAVSDAFPRTAVLLVDVGSAGVTVVIAAHDFLMLFAIRTVCKAAAAGISAGTLGLQGNADHLFIISCFSRCCLVKWGL